MYGQCSRAGQPKDGVRSENLGGKVVILIGECLFKLESNKNRVTRWCTLLRKKKCQFTSCQSSLQGRRIVGVMSLFNFSLIPINCYVMALVPVSDHRWRCCRGRFNFRQRTLIGYQSSLFSHDFFYLSLGFNFQITLGC